MPSLKLPKAATPLMTETVHRIQIQAYIAAVKPHQDELMAWRPEDAQELVDHDTLIREVIPPEVLQHSAVGHIVKLDVRTVLEVLQRLHPTLHRVLSTEEGQRWLRMQQQDLGGQNHAAAPPRT